MPKLVHVRQDPLGLALLPTRGPALQRAVEPFRDFLQRDEVGLRALEDGEECAGLGLRVGGVAGEGVVGQETQAGVASAE